MCRVSAMIACFLLAAALGADSAGSAAGAGKKKKKSDDPVSLEELSKMLRPLLVQAMPKVLYEAESNWGNQRPTPHAIHWRGLRPKIVRELRNDGTWRKLKVTAEHLDKTLEFRLSGLKKLDAERQTFKCFVSFRTGVYFDQQIWESGVRLHSGSTKAHLQIRALMDVENTIRTEPSKSFIPDVVFRLRVTDAKVWYKDLEFERVAGIGGDAAPILGEALHDALDRFRPSLERDLLKKASAAIVKAADTKEVRLSLGGLLGSK
jgi:hypothetical protein